MQQLEKQHCSIQFLLTSTTLYTYLNSIHPLFNV